MDSVQLPFLALAFIPGSHGMLPEISMLIHKAVALQISLISLSFIVFVIQTCIYFSAKSAHQFIAGSFCCS